MEAHVILEYYSAKISLKNSLAVQKVGGNDSLSSTQSAIQLGLLGLVGWSATEWREWGFLVSKRLFVFGLVGCGGFGMVVGLQGNRLRIIVCADSFLVLRGCVFGVFVWVGD